MKTIIKGGLCLALGWLANDAVAQDVIWRAAAPKNTSPVAVVSPQADAVPSPQPSGITLSRPTPLDGPGGFAPIIRAQAADNPGDAPRQLPKDGKTFVPPPPQPIAGSASPVFGPLGMDDCSSPCLPLGNAGADRPRFWASAEALLWWQRGQNVPPLVTQSPVGTVPALNLPTTSVLYDSVDNPTRVGGRFALGMWMPHFNNNLGIEVNYFFLARTSSTATFASDGNPVLGRPFFDVTPPPAGPLGPTAEVFAGAANSGVTTIHTYSEVWGLEGNLRYKWYSGPSYWLDVIGGYRYLNLSEGIDIEEAQRVNAAPNFTTTERDSFHTRNQFNGFQIGLDGEHQLWNRWFIGATAKVAIGSVYETTVINGSTTFANFPSPPFTNGVLPGGLLASQTNIGTHNQYRFGVLPELGLKLGFDVTSHLRLFVGYDFIYLNSVVRPGDQIDPRVNTMYSTLNLPTVPGTGPRLPAVLNQTSSYWAQGVNFGLMYRY